MNTRGTRLTERDRMILTFAAEHRIVLKRQLDVLTRTDVSERMPKLVRSGCLKEGENLPLKHYLIRRPGLLAIGSTLRPPEPKLVEYKHDVGLAWLWLGAHRGAFGPLREVLSERRLRSHDGVRERPPDPYGIHLGGFDRYGNKALHHPDLLLIDHDGRRLAVELELSGKGRGRLDRILGAYAGDARINRVLYLVEDNSEGRRLGRAVGTAAREIGLWSLVHVQRITPIRTTERDASSLVGDRTRPAFRADMQLSR